MVGGARGGAAPSPPPRSQALSFLRGHYIDAKPFSAVLLRVQRFFAQRDLDCSSYCDARELRALFAALGVALTDAEFAEACACLNTSGDSRFHIDEVVAWLSPGHAGL